MKRLLSLLFLGLGLYWLAQNTLFTVTERQAAIVFAFGEFRREITEPGLHVKLPSPLETVTYFDQRVLTLSSPNVESVQTLEKKNLNISYFVKWKIVDPKKFYVQFKGGEADAQTRLATMVRNAVNSQVNKYAVVDVVSTYRGAIMNNIRESVALSVEPLGIAILDVRFRRVDFADNISTSVFSRMESERRQAANRQRAEGDAERERIRAEAERERSVILASAQRSAQEIKAQADAEAASIYAKAYESNPEFYRFYRSLEAYRNTFSEPSDILVVDPNTEFFDYMNHSGVRK